MGRFLITGGAGFIGTHLGHRLLQTGHQVVALDDLSRRGSDRNAQWLQQHPGFTLERVDLRDADEVARVCAAQGYAAVFHEGGQVAVTSSVEDPRTDFEINALGTFNVLEGIRLARQKPVVIFASTNKVYGGLEECRVDLSPEGRYRLTDLPQGVPESWPLDFHSPYGCSKGSADQYVHDYARIYGLPTVVFRQSCIYGTRQFGVEDQGWVAWFTIATALGRPITIYGDGRQIRDVLWVEDLVDAYLAAVALGPRVAGRIYNIGGGPDSALSLLDLVELLREIRGEEIPLSFADWRPGDQKAYVSDVGRAASELGWSPRVSPREGVTRLARWVEENRSLIQQVLD